MPKIKETGTYKVTGTDGEDQFYIGNKGDDLPDGWEYVGPADHIEAAKEEGQVLDNAEQDAANEQRNAGAAPENRMVNTQVASTRGSKTASAK